MNMAYEHYRKMLQEGKSLAEIAYTAQQDYYAEYGEGALKNKCKWDTHPTALAKASYMYMIDIILFLNDEQTHFDMG
jgi:hypothetical protein